MDDEIKICSLQGNYLGRIEVIDAIKEQLDNYNLYTYYEELNAEIVEEEILGNALSDESKLIILNYLPKFSSCKNQLSRWKNVFNKIANGTIVILNDIIPPLASHDVDKKKKYKNEVSRDTAKKLVKYTGTIGKIFKKYDEYLKYKEAKVLLIKELSLINLSLKNEDLFPFLQIVGNVNGLGYNTDRLLLHIQKMSCFLGRRKNIERNDIVSIADGCAPFYVWDLINAIDNRDMVKAFRMINIAFEKFSSPQQAATNILNRMNERFFLLLYIKTCLRDGVVPDDIIDQASKIKKLQRNGSGLEVVYNISQNQSSYSKQMIRGMMDSVFGKPPIISKYSFKSLLLLIKNCKEGILSLRSGADKIESLQLLDKMIFLTMDMNLYHNRIG